MRRRDFLSLGVAVLATPALVTSVSAQQLSLGEVSAYLNRLVTAQGGFTQINGDGTLSTGQIYIKRPGRVRFEYNAPDNSLMIAGGGQVAIFDPRSNTPPNRYPLSQTPLSIILEQNVDLAQRRMVTGHTTDGTSTTVTAQDPDNPEYGNIQLVFTGSPVELRQWVVTDDTGGQTTVILNDVVSGVAIGEAKFNIVSEMRQRGFE